MEMRWTLAALTVSLGIILIQTNIHTEAKTDMAGTSQVNGGSRTRVNLRELFASVAKNDMKKAGAYRNILERDAMTEQQEFDTMKEQFRFARQRNAHQQMDSPHDDNIDEKAPAVKRETKEDDDDDDGELGGSTEYEEEEDAEGVEGVEGVEEAEEEQSQRDEDSMEEESRESVPGTVTCKDIFDSAAKNDLESLKYYVEKKDVPVNAMNEDDQTAAHIAAKLGHRTILQYLISQDRKVVFLKDKFDQTILHVAVKVGDLDMVRYLIEECRANPLTPKGRVFGDTCVHIAANEGRMEVLRYLLERERLNPNIRNKLGETPLFLAAEKMHLRIVQYLLEEHRANPTVVDNNQRNVLFQSAIKGDVDVPKYLLDEMKVPLDVNWQDTFGQTIMFRAVIYDKLPFIQYLVERKKANMNIADKEGFTPIMKAANEANTAIVQYLLGKGAEADIDSGGKNSLKKLAKGRALKTYLESISPSLNSTSPTTGSTAPSSTSEPAARKRRFAEVEKIGPNLAPFSFIFGAPMFHL